MGDERDDAPIVRMANAILLSALKNNASLISIRWLDVTGLQALRPDEQAMAEMIDGAIAAKGGSIVELVIADKLVEQLVLPAKLHGFVMRRLCVMGNVPLYTKGKADDAWGRIQLKVGDRPQLAYFDLVVRGHGDTLRMQLAVHGFCERPPPFVPPGMMEHLPLR